MSTLVVNASTHGHTAKDRCPSDYDFTDRAAVDESAHAGVALPATRTALSSRQAD